MSPRPLEAAWGHGPTWLFCDSFINTALFRSNWEYLGTPASLDLSFGNRYWFSCLWLLRPRVSPLASHLAACWASEAEDVEVAAVAYFRSDSILKHWTNTGAGVSRVQDWSKDLKTQKHIVRGQEQFMGMKMVKNVTKLYVPPEKTLDCYTAKCPFCLNSPLSYLIDFTPI